MKKITAYQILLAVAVIVIVILAVKPFNWGKKSDQTAFAPAENVENMNQREWKKIDPKEIEDNPVALTADDWLALAAGKEGDMNAMTIAWGSIGSLWGKPVVTVYVSTDRYTFGFMERNEYFTVTAFPEQDRARLQYLGSHSGRDGDKIKEAGADGGIYPVG